MDNVFNINGSPYIPPEEENEDFIDGEVSEILQSLINDAKNISHVFVVVRDIDGYEECYHNDMLPDTMVSLSLQGFNHAQNFKFNDGFISYDDCEDDYDDEEDDSY